ncbi:MAG: transporter substrate-binding domain-containing protein [Oscillospiraceae bacterium]|nr:transporter substrate-binding domain-containing protein [Oscillospiraceae bacterium]
MKKLICTLLSLAMVLGLAACGSSGAANNAADAAPAASAANSAESDLAYIQDKGTLVVGITEFEPMDYQDANGNWIGFDADMAAAFAESLGVTVEFQIIDWDNKVFELDGKTIDCVWNGMTLTDEVKAAMECSNPYFNNAQVVIVPADVADQYQDVESVKALNFAVESGSAGQAEVEALNAAYTEVADQATALLEVSSGNAEAAVIDFLMAKAMVGEGTSYAGLIDTVSLNSEEYGVGFRKGSDLAAALNQFLADNADVVRATAETYGIADALVEQ